MTDQPERSRKICRFPAYLTIGLALAILPLWGCSEDESIDDPIDMPPDGDVLLEPPAEGEGFQFVMNTQLEAGVEAEHCMFVKTPDSGMFVNRDEVRFTSGSHHFLLYETEYTEIPTAKDDGTPVDTSGVFDCSSGPTDGWSITRLIGGSQNATGTSMLSFPPDVAISVDPGRVLLMNAHYINASDQLLEPEVRINLYTLAEEEVAQEGDLLFLYNPFIRVGAQSQSRARMLCPINQDITIVNVQSHMHARGVGYSASIEGQEPFYTNTQWENVPVKSFADQGGLQVPAGSRFDYHCDFSNSEARAVYQGPQSTDEMCMLIGSYYPADYLLSNCLEDNGLVLASEWVGNGTATCAQTLACQQAAFGSETFLEDLTDCLLDADPAVSKPASEALRCFVRSANPPMDCAQEIQTCQAM